MDPDLPAPRRRIHCGLCAQQGHDRRHCRAAAIYRAGFPEMTEADLTRHRTAIRMLAEAGLPPVPPPLPRVRCITNQAHPHWGDRFQCHNMSVPGQQYCARCESQRPRPDLPPEQRCSVGRCECIIAERGMCKRHLARDVTRRKNAYLVQTWNRAIERMEIDPSTWPQIVQEWADHMPPADLGGGRWWRTLIRGLRVRLAHEYFIRDLWNQEHPHDPMDANGVIDWHWNRRLHPRAPAHPPGTLAAFAADGQNVHTGVVSNQTHEGVKKLLAIPIRPGQSERTGAFIAHVVEMMVKYGWSTKRDGDRIVADSLHWYGQATCRAHHDWLYKRVLDGLVITICAIEDMSTRGELYKRLHEEMRDSLGMCCDGHITRLINVLAGFDEAFAPKLSVGEQLQMFFGKLAEKETEIMEKMAEASEFLTKLQVPHAEWEPWIDAL